LPASVSCVAPSCAQGSGIFELAPGCLGERQSKLIPTTTDASIRFDVPKPATGAQILEYPLEIEHVGFPLGTIEPTGMGSCRIGLERCLTLQDPAGDVLIQHHTARIETCPEGRVIGPMLAQQRLERHHLMGAFNLGMVGGTALAGKAHVDA
jgi:hypothetical protein